MEIIKDRIYAELEGEFVVFMIGMRINKLWKIWKWWPVFTAMPRMIIELYKNPELGMLSARSHFGLRNQLVIQYWRSFEALEAYAKNPNLAHLPAWAEFRKKIGTSGDVGIWHETYVIKDGAYENIYANMPPYGLGKVGKRVSVKKSKDKAKARMG